MSRVVVFFGWVFRVISPNVIPPPFTFLRGSDIVYISPYIKFEEFIAKGRIGGFVCAAQGGFKG